MRRGFPRLQRDGGGVFSDPPRRFSSNAFFPRPAMTQKRGVESNDPPTRPATAYRAASGSGARPPSPSRRHEPISERVWSVARSTANPEGRAATCVGYSVSHSRPNRWRCSAVRGAHRAPRGARRAVRVRRTHARTHARARAVARVEPRSAGNTIPLRAFGTD